MNTLLLTILSILPFNLDWNINWRTDTPYEVAVDLAKIGVDSPDLQVFADNKPIPTIRLEDATKEQKTTIYRFSVPAGTRSLAMKPGICKAVNSNSVDNLIINPEWIVDKNITKSEKDGVTLLEEKEFSVAISRCCINVPKGMAGKPVALELDLKNISQSTWPLKIWMEQFDNDGRLLPEPVWDPRWTTHNRPSGKFTSHRENGYIHPDAETLELVIQMTGMKNAFDEYGLPLKDRKPTLPRLEISRFVLRPSAEMPFPKYDDSFFGNGVSGREGDASLVFDGDRTFWFSTRSLASYAGGVQIRKESQIFFPTADATVELWIKPDWSKETSRERIIFEANDHNIKGLSGYGRRNRGPVFTLSYKPQTKDILLFLKDTGDNKYNGKGNMEIPSGQWSHIAVTLNVKKGAEVYINGQLAFTLPVGEFKTLDLENDPLPNDNHTVAFTIGDGYQNARSNEEFDRLSRNYKYFQGEMDLLRISTGIRYTGAFKPIKDYVCDSDTRAYFSFDRSFDGRSGGGIGWISGSMSAPTDIIDHKLGSLQYYPENIIDEYNPALTMFPRVKEIPGPEDFAASERIGRLDLNIKAGESKPIHAPEGIFTDYVEIENTGNDVLLYPAVLNTGDIDARSYGDIKESLCAEGASDRSKVNKFFNYLLVASDYFMTHHPLFRIGTDVPIYVEGNPLDIINSYCCFECGPLNEAAATLFATGAMCPSNITMGYGHMFEQVYFGGQNHIYDLSMQKFFPAMNNETSAGLREADIQEGVIRRLGGTADHFTRLGTRNVPSYIYANPEKFAVSLNPGEKIRFWSINEGVSNDLQIYKERAVNEHMMEFTDYAEIVGAKKGNGLGIYRVDRFEPEFGNAFLTFNGTPSAENPAFTRIESDSFCYNVKTFYAIMAADYKATDKNGKNIPLEISTDGGKTFRPFINPATYQVRARKGYLIRINAPINETSNFSATTEMEVNSRVITGRLHSGDNLLTLKAEGGSSARIVWQYRTKGKPIEFSEGVPFGSIVGCEQTLAVLDPKKGTLKMSVSGVGDSAVAIAKGGLSASLSNGGLTIKTTDKNPHIGWVTVVDGAFRKTLTVLVCPGARLEEANIYFTEKGQTEEIVLNRLPAGKYAVFMLERFGVDLKFPRRNTVEMKLGTAKAVNTCSAINSGSDYYKDIMGPDGGRGVWRWDYPLDSHYYPYRDLLFLETDATDSITLKCTGTEGPVEISHLLVLPEMDREFKCSLIRNLTGRNIRPWAIR